jgi:catechol 2,3-dioxygenase-like lactoylglutathione lyase family enzyme
MIDHMSLPVSDIARARQLYDSILGTLGVRRVLDIEEADAIASGYGDPGKPESAFWIGAGEPPAEGGLPPPREGMHVAFAAKDRAAVDAWHRAALAAGCTDNGAPGLRPHYHPNYYAAFVIDPDGNRLEAVCHAPA